MIVHDTRLFRVEAPGFNAGVEINKHGFVTRMAPILKKELIYGIKSLRRVCQSRGWKIEECRWARFKE